MPEPVDVPDAQWMRYTGDTPTIVIGAGEWGPGEVRWTPGWLVDRLPPGTFTPAPAPDGGGVPAPDAPLPRRRSKPSPEATQPDHLGGDV